MKLLLVGTLLLLAGCTKEQTITKPMIAEQNASSSDVMEIIRSAAAAAPNGVHGEYILDIKASGMSRGILFLNTELDYRDQRSISVAIFPEALKTFKRKYGESTADFFIGKRIIVEGEAIRRSILFHRDGDKKPLTYYYQTHVTVTDYEQIKVIDASIEDLDKQSIHS